MAMFSLPWRKGGENREWKEQSSEMHPLQP
jgi:hypothetical protein